MQIDPLRHSAAEMAVCALLFSILDRMRERAYRRRLHRHNIKYQKGDLTHYDIGEFSRPVSLRTLLFRLSYTGKLPSELKHYEINMVQCVQLHEHNPTIEDLERMWKYHLGVYTAQGELGVDLLLCARHKLEKALIPVKIKVRYAVIIATPFLEVSTTTNSNITILLVHHQVLLLWYPKAVSNDVS